MFQVFQSYKFQSSHSFFLVFLLISHVVLFFFLFTFVTTQSAVHNRKGAALFYFYWQITILPLMSLLFPFDGPYSLLALPSSVHPKILTRFYSIYFKVPNKISAQSNGRI